MSQIKGKISQIIGPVIDVSFENSETLPNLLEDLDNLDIGVFLDAANIWGVDYFDGEDEGSEIRSSIGVGIDWFSVIGPINFSLTENISKASTDITESFRFNIGTTF